MLKLTAGRLTYRFSVSQGTSCASPTASGVISLINDARLAAGKTQLGYLNPRENLPQPLASAAPLHTSAHNSSAGSPTCCFVCWNCAVFYKNPGAFNDITTGSGGGCHAGVKSEKGFPAKKGWDPVTGLGTPNYAAMMAAFL